jgi:hypothetical protein
VKALSLTQPWADIILDHGKRVENRQAWSGCAYRGPVLLHASASIGTRAHAAATLEIIAGAGVPWDYLGERFDVESSPLGTVTKLRPRAALRLGGIVGRAEIVDVIDTSERAQRADEEPDSVGGQRVSGDTFDRWVARGGDAEQRKWWFGGFALILANVERVPFVTWKGALGLFTVADDYATIGGAR